MSTRMIDKVSSWAKVAQFWLLPGTCILCRQGSGTHADICATCKAGFIPLDNPCPGCALPLPNEGLIRMLCGKCLDPGRLVSRTVAAFAYQPPLAGLIGQFKYNEKLQHGRVLTDLLVQRVHEQYQSAGLPQLLLPVPLHPARQRQRGYNQALLIARQLGKALEIPVAHDVLGRAINTSAQQGLNAKERKQNLRRAFTLDAPHALRQVSSVALVDDVITTMSTVRELARLIRSKTGPDLAIHAWCIARA